MLPKILLREIVETLPKIKMVTELLHVLVKLCVTNNCVTIFIFRNVSTIFVSNILGNIALIKFLSNHANEEINVLLFGCPHCHAFHLSVPYMIRLD